MGTTCFLLFHCISAMLLNTTLDSSKQLLD